MKIPQSSVLTVTGDNGRQQSHSCGAKASGTKR